VDGELGRKGEPKEITEYQQTFIATAAVPKTGFRSGMRNYHLSQKTKLNTTRWDKRNGFFATKIKEINTQHRRANKKFFTK
jgi:hypothetical protein